MQKFPFRPRVPLRLDRLHESLYPALAIDEAPALLRVRATRQQVMRKLGRPVRQNVADDQRLQFPEQVWTNAVLRHILTEDNQRLDRAIVDSVGDLRQVRSHLRGRNASQPGAVRIGIAVGAQEQLVGFAGARH